MNELAQLKRAGRIEVIRERNANYHVFAFIDGARPPDDLVAASLEKAGAPPKETEEKAAEPAKPQRKARAKVVKKRRPRANARKRRR